jgi:Holliday junction resolvasome RuvABC endonuclease subunit
MKILSIDPGVDTGYALWTRNGRSWAFIKAGEWKGSRKNHWEAKLDYCVRSFIDTIRNEEIAFVVIEQPFQAFNAANESQSIVKLCILAGAYLGALAAINTVCAYKLVQVQEWKGQLPKEICHRRIRKLLPRLDKKYSHNTMDAIGIGLHLLGEF